MIPWFEIPSLKLPFGIEIHAFGALIAIGISIGARLALRAAQRYGPGDSTAIQKVVPWAVAGGFLGAQLLHLFGYHPELLAGSWSAMFGFSSMGGVLGALIAMVAYLKVTGVPVRPHLDALALGTAPGWAIGRIGCFLAHDHPGVLTDFPLALQFPGGARHDLGLYDALLLFALTGILYALSRKKRIDGTLMGVLAVGYSVPRFFLDFLRASDMSFVDRRILGLTPAQYIVVALCIAGVVLLKPALGASLRRIRMSRRARLVIVGAGLATSFGCEVPEASAVEAHSSAGGASNSAVQPSFIEEKG